jgi:hypothetical protein
MAEHAEEMTRLKRAKADVKQYSIDHEPSRWAEAHMLLARQCVNEVFESSPPTRVADKGIEHIEEALKVITEKNNFPDFVIAQAWLVRLYPKCVAGSRTENLTKALACAQTSLRVCQQPNCPPDLLAELHELIGSIYADDDFESCDSRAASQDLAIRHYLASLQHSAMDDDEDKWADRQLKVGMIYFHRKNGNRRSNMKVAIKHLVNALKVFTKSKHRDDWAKTHEYLAMSYAELQAANLTKTSKEKYAEEQSTLVEKCIASSTNALQVFTPTYGSTSW